MGMGRQHEDDHGTIPAAPRPAIVPPQHPRGPVASPPGSSADDSPDEPGPDETGMDGTVCLLTPLDAHQGLSHTLLQYLSEQMPEITFTMQEGGDVHAIWLCGYESGSARAIARLRAGHPDALLLVTGRGDPALWEREAFEAGADHACAWPLPYARLASLLSSRHERRAARSSSG